MTDEMWIRCLGCDTLHSWDHLKNYTTNDPGEKIGACVCSECGGVHFERVEFLPLGDVDPEIDEP